MGKVYFEVASSEILPGKIEMFISSFETGFDIIKLFAL